MTVQVHHACKSEAKCRDIKGYCFTINLDLDISRYMNNAYNNSDIVYNGCLGGMEYVAVHNNGLPPNIGVVWQSMMNCDH